MMYFNFENFCYLKRNLKMIFVEFFNLKKILLKFKNNHFNFRCYQEKGQL